jgi:hypothetical protein
MVRMITYERSTLNEQRTRETITLRTLPLGQ